MVSKGLDARGILCCLEKVDQADIVYVVNPGGYVGKSVSARLCEKISPSMSCIQ